MGVLISCTSAQKEKKNRTKTVSPLSSSAQQQREKELLTQHHPLDILCYARRQTAPQVCGMILCLTGVCARFIFILQFGEGIHTHTQQIATAA